MSFPRPHRSLVVAALTCTSILIACELILRSDSVRQALPAPNLYYDTEVETRAQRLVSLSSQQQPLDLLFIGSSIVRTNVSPLVFDEQLLDAGHVPFTSFNGGLSGLGLDAVQLYLRNFWLEQANPAAVVQGVRFSELNNAPAATSQAVYRGQLERHWIDGDDPWRLQEAALRHVHLLHYRGEFMETLRHFQKGAPLAALAQRFDYPVDERGHGPSRKTLAEFRRSPGFRPAVSAIDPADQPDFAAGLDYLQRSHQACVDRGIAYLVVNIPDHAERYASPSTDSPYGKYLRILGDFCHERQIPFVDMTDGDPRKYNSDSDFADFDHLNDRGAAEFSAELARRVAPLLDPPKPSKVAAK